MHCNIFQALLRKICLIQKKNPNFLKQHIFQNQRHHSNMLNKAHTLNRRKKMYFLVTKILKQILFMHNIVYPTHEKKNHRQGIL